MRGGLFNPITDPQVVIASIPVHYERDIRWAQKSGERTVLQSPNKLTVNIGSGGYKLNAMSEINLNTAANWDSVATDYTVAAARAGKNFYIYTCQPTNGPTPIILLSANSTVPTGYNANNSRKVGGFHCLCVAVNHNGTLAAWAASTSIAVGVTRKATAWDGYLYRCTTAGTTAATQPVWANFAVGESITDNTVTWLKEIHSLEGYLAGDILPNSVWDLKHRPVSSPEGMVFSEGANCWVDIYLQSGTGANTASVYNTTITDTRNWMDFVDDAGAVKKRTLNDIEFQLIAAGSNEQTNIQGSADPVTTGGHVDTAGRRMISNIGCEDCCGAMYQWLNEQTYRYDGGSHTHAFTGTALATHTHTENQEASYTQNVQTEAKTAGTPAGTNGSVDSMPSFAWYTLPGSKGSLYKQGTYGDVKLLAGAAWTNGADSGSRARYASSYRWATYSSVGCRLRAEPLRA